MKLSLVVLFACAACQPTSIEGLDLEPPRVLGTSLPVDGVISPTAVIRIRFSEPIAPDTVTADTIAVVPHDVEGQCSTDLSCTAGARCHAERCQQDAVDRLWIADMASPPLSSRRRRRLAARALGLEEGGTLVVLRCLAPLQPLVRHALLVGPTVSDRAGHRVALEQGERLALHRIFATGDASTGRPTVWLRSPSPRSADLPRNLARVVVRFSRPVTGVSAATLGLELVPGQSVATSLRQPSPRCRGLAAGICYELQVKQILPPRCEIALRVGQGIRDAAGLPVLPATGQVIATGDNLDTVPPRTDTLRLHLADGCALVRLRSEELTDLMMEGDWGLAAESSVGALSHEVALRAPAATGRLLVTVEDLAGNRAQVKLRVQPSKTASVAITEVLANPVGTEPAQELVELLNLGATPVSLGGWVLDDNDDGVGASLLPDLTLAPGQYGVVVGKGYQPAGLLDPAPPPGALLLRLSGTLGASGLANTGETVVLRDAVGRLVSSYGNQLGAVSGKSKGGRSVQRLVAGACDVRDNWSLAPATPGRGVADP